MKADGFSLAGGEKFLKKFLPYWLDALDWVIWGCARVSLLPGDEMRWSGGESELNGIEWDRMDSNRVKWSQICEMVRWSGSALETQNLVSCQMLILKLTWCENYCAMTIVRWPDILSQMLYLYSNCDISCVREPYPSSKYLFVMQNHTFSFSPYNSI